MKTEDLKAQGLTEEQISFVMAENGKDIGKVKKDLENMTAERDKEKSRADTAEETLKGFDGVDVEGLNKSIADWKKKAEDAEKDYKQKLDDRDFNDLVSAEIAKANGLNKKAIMALLDVDTLKDSKNQKDDVASAIKALAEAEDSKFLFKAADNKPVPHFTSVNKGGAGSGTVIKSKDDIFAMENGKYKYSAAERDQLIADNIELFQ